MTSRDFCYWLQGHFEISDKTSLNERETTLVKRHLAMVFKHEIDPSFKDADELRELHTPPTQSKISGPSRSSLDLPLMC